MGEPRTIVSARAIEVADGLAAPGSTFDRRCNTCGHHVALSLAAQALLVREPETKLCCIECLHIAAGDTLCILPGALEEAMTHLANLKRSGKLT